jgi:hypothetical protein
VRRPMTMSLGKIGIQGFRITFYHELSPFA